MPGFKSIDGFLLDLGDVVIDMTSIHRAYEACIEDVVEHFRKVEDASNLGRDEDRVSTPVVKFVISYYGKLRYIRENFGDWHAFMSALRTLGQTRHELHKYSVAELLIKEFEEEIHGGELESQLNDLEKRLLLKFMAAAKRFTKPIRVIPAGADFLRLLRRNDLKYVFVTDIPYSPADARDKITSLNGLSGLVDRYQIIPSTELGVIKRDSDIPFLAGLALIERGWRFYKNNFVIARNSEMYASDLRKCAGKIAGFFDNPAEFARAQQLGIRAFLCGYSGRVDVRTGWFEIRDLGGAEHKLRILDEILTNHPEIDNRMITQQFVDSYLSARGGEYYNRK